MRIHATNAGGAQARMSVFDGAEAVRKRFVRNPNLRTVQPLSQAAATASSATSAATSTPPPPPSTPKAQPGLLKRGSAAIGAIGAMTGAYDSIKDLDTGYREEFNKSIGSDGAGRGLMSGDADLLRVAGNVGNAITGGYAGRVGQGLSSKLSGGTFSEGFNEPTHRDRFMARQPVSAPQITRDDRDIPTSQEAPISTSPTKAMDAPINRDRGSRSPGQSQPPSDDQTYEALRNDVGGAIDRGLPAPAADGSDARNSLTQRGNAGLRALASDEGFRTRMNDQYQRDNLGVQASTDAQGRMVFSDAPRDAGRATTQRAISSGGDMGAVNQSMARANAIRGGTGGAEARLSAFDRQTASQEAGRRSSKYGLVFRDKGREREREQLAGSLERQAERDSGAEGRMLANDRARIENEQQQTILNLQRLALDGDSNALKQLNALLGRKDDDRNAQVVYEEELLDPTQPIAGVRKVPLVLNRDGTATRVTQRQQAKPLPPGVTRDQVLMSARNFIANGADPAAVAERLQQFGLSLEQ